ncbi:hypothetical protein [Actinomadura rugatobispora]|uniref:Uncharacterized protein n=1 Tax=Actinomadura rugatobispora TaxID=1994 RepID=A0ABW1A4N5_9ACTN|nr:hypothetical protein GCM10010200_055130 [Actinomadura rugatobispora]
MAYPGDQGKPGGWSRDQPSHAPYGPDRDRPEEAPYGSGEKKDESPFPPRDDAFGGPAVSWDEDPADGTTPAPRPLGAAAGGPLAGPAAPPTLQGGPLAGPGAPSGPGGPGGPGGFQVEGPGGSDPYGPPPGNDPYGPPPGKDPYGPPAGDDPYGPPPGGHYSPGGYDDDAYGEPHGFGTPEGPGGPGSDHRRGPTPPAKRRSLPLIIGGAAAAGLLLIGGGFAVSSMLGDDKAEAGNTSATPPTQTPTAQPSPTQPVLEPVKLKNRATDPSPLTLNEVFGKKSFTGGGQKYVRTGWNAKKGCTGTVQGAKLAAVVKKGGCTQALRATFARGDGKLIGTVGVLNLKTDAAAKLAQRAAVAKDAFLQPLPGTGVSKTIGKGEALGTAEARGHYLLMTWVQRPDGKKIPAQYHKTVSAFGQQLIRGSSLSFALHYRETEGKPFRN